MEKRPLDQYLYSRNDYSIFGTPRMKARRYSFKDITGNQGRYHDDKCADALEELKALTGLKLSEYFTYLPDCIDALHDLPAFMDCDDIKNMSVGKAFIIIAEIDDYSEDYNRKEALIDVCQIMIRPIIDSGFAHPLYRSFFRHILEAVYEDTGNEDIQTGSRSMLMINMNDSLHKLLPNGPAAYMPKYFNYIIRPFYALTTSHGDLTIHRRNSVP